MKNVFVVTSEDSSGNVFIEGVGSTEAQAKDIIDRSKLFRDEEHAHTNYHVQKVGMNNAIDGFQHGYWKK